MHGLFFFSIFFPLNAASPSICSISWLKTCRQPLYLRQTEAPSSRRTSYLHPSKWDGSRYRRVVSHLVSVAASLLLTDFRDDLRMMRCDCSELEPRPCAIKAPVGDQSSGPQCRTLNNFKWIDGITLRPVMLSVKSTVAVARIPFICASWVQNLDPVGGFWHRVWRKRWVAVQDGDAHGC